MSRKTIDEYEDLYNLARPPTTSHQQNDDTRAQALIDGALNDRTSVPSSSCACTSM